MSEWFKIIVKKIKIFKLERVEIFNTVQSNQKKDCNQFLGICLDTGAQKSVFGSKQASAYLKLARTDFSPKPSRYAFRFGDGFYKSLGTISVLVPTPNGKCLEMCIDVVEANVPMLVGLDILDKENLLADNTSNMLVHRRKGWKMPLVRKNGHLYFQWNYADIHYTERELEKLHLHFYHPSTGKLFNLIRRTVPIKATS